MAKKSKKIVNVAAATDLPHKRVRKSFGQILFNHSLNFGRIASLRGTDSNLTAIRQSLANSGMTSDHVPSACFATQEEIDHELKVRAALRADVAEQLKHAEKGKIPWLRAWLDVIDYYYADTMPEICQITAHQRGSQYLLAMADRLHSVRKSGWDGAGIPPVPGVDADKASAADVCQQSYFVDDYGVISLPERIDLQFREQGSAVGATPSTAADYGIGLLASWKAGSPMCTEAQFSRRENIKRGVSQDAFLIARVGWEIRNLYDLVDAVRKGENDPTLWATRRVSTGTLAITRALLKRLTPEGLREHNAKRAESSEPPVGLSTPEELLAHITQDFELVDKPKGLAWSEAETDAIAANQYLGSYIVACRAGKEAVEIWHSENRQTGKLLRLMSIDPAIREAHLSDLPEGAEADEELEESEA